MRTSKFLLATLKETPTDAEVVSHQLMLRAGLIRKVAAGIYNWLPLGLRIIRKVEKIVREEMDASGAQEILMPAVQPAELWQESGRWEKYGPELLRFHDRHQRDFCYGPTHEEVITTLAGNEIRSYRQLPMNFYQIQTKFRDEIRPRFGVMRGREFIMKDAYSFHIDDESLDQTYQLMHQTYSRIFTRLGLKFRAVNADSGSIGGSSSHEFHVLAKSGEDVIVVSDQSDYVANIELAEAPALKPAKPAELGEMQIVDTPNIKTINALVQKYDLPIERTIKTLVVAASNDADANLVALLVRGDHELNPIKAEKLQQVAKPLRMADETEIREAIGAGPGSLGPVNLPIPCVIDRSVAECNNFAAGANIEGKHYFNINWVRDLPMLSVADIRNVVEGDASPDGRGTLSLVRGIEVGHIFKLGSQYSEVMQATVLDDGGKSIAMPMGCYGIGITRAVAAAIEQNHDDKGIVWPDAIAPFDVAIVSIGHNRSAEVARTVTEVEAKLTYVGIEVLVDDRDERPGVMFADIELIGIPHRLTIGGRGLKKGIIEYQHRRSGKQLEIPVEDLTEVLTELMNAPEGSD